jgi:hypothetical protein
MLRRIAKRQSGGAASIARSGRRGKKMVMRTATFAAFDKHID